MQAARRPRPATAFDTTVASLSTVCLAFGVSRTDLAFLTEEQEEQYEEYLEKGRSTTNEENNP